jgi:UDP-N-acetylmuramyl pentapeptide phosphotransferase/UDP-N-acetylglucosamine-1-phosphate transferase
VLSGSLCSALIVLAVVPIGTLMALRRLGVVAANFRGTPIPNAFGLAILICAAPLLLLDAALHPANAGDRAAWLACILAFGLLGLLDDLRGDGNVKGIRGHVRALLRDRKVTTGLLKAVGGVIAALALASLLQPGRPLLILLDAGLIALSANALNLLDLRPGRACGVFCLAALVLLASTLVRGAPPSMPGLLFVLAPALVAWPFDASARAMLGDTGSNLLGAALGFGLCVYSGVGVQIAALALLIGLHIIAERESITAIIERHPFLRAVDRLTGVR